MIINPVNNADFSAYIKSTGFYNSPYNSNKFDARVQSVYIDKTSNQPVYTPNAPVTKTRDSFRNLFEKAQKTVNSDDTDSVKENRNSIGKDKSSNGKKVNAKGNGFVITIPEEHIKNLEQFKTDLQHQVYELFNPEPDTYRGALVDVVA